MHPAATRSDSAVRTVITNVHQGQFEVAGTSEVTLSTVLGSCVAACVRDRVAQIGGMNHFLLAEPSDSARAASGESARYGAFAMEKLINSVLSRGTGRKANLEFKAFGGGLMSAALADVGSKNVQFLRQFLQSEGYHLVSEDLGGAFARRVLYTPHTGKAMVKRLDANAADGVTRDELLLVGRRAAAPVQTPDIELF